MKRIIRGPFKNGGIGPRKKEGLTKELKAIVRFVVANGKLSSFAWCCALKVVFGPNSGQSRGLPALKKLVW